MSTIKLAIEVTREGDDTFSISLEDLDIPEGDDARYLNGLSEGYETDPIRVATTAASLVASELLNRLGVPNDLSGVPWTRHSDGATVAV